jgi:site-specific DNA recombinase
VPEEFVFRESFSGLTTQRPKLTELRQKAGEIDAIIVHTPDRLARVGEDILSLAKEFKMAGIKLLFVKEQWDDTLNGKLIAFILGWASEFECSQIIERTSRGRQARIKSGRLANGKASYLYGYNYIAGDGKRVIVPQTSRVVKDIFQWFTDDGLTIHGLIYRLRDLRITSPSGKRMWARATVWGMLKQKAYVGDAFTPGIIDQGAYDKAQARLRYNAEMARRNCKREYLLRGHVFCKNCGRKYQGAFKRFQTKVGVREYQYYRCTGNDNVFAPPCHNPSWRCALLDDIVWREVNSILSNPQVIMNGVESIKDDGGVLQQELAQCGERLLDIERQQEQLLQWALKGFPEDTVIKENERLNQDRFNLQQRQSELETRISQIRQSQIGLEDIQKAFNTIKGNLGNLSFTEKRLALAALGIRMELDKDNILITGSIPLGAVASSSSPPSFWAGSALPLPPSPLPPP